MTNSEFAKLKKDEICIRMQKKCKNSKLHIFCLKYESQYDASNVNWTDAILNVSLPTLFHSARACHWSSHHHLAGSSCTDHHTVM